ncbi:MAG: hypothetical protein DRN04_06225 [Thermoprotei archaeon]|nr:MAG: hypothetical protein DRN04_06225 [Thermoprotei archaeon]
MGYGYKRRDTTDIVAVIEALPEIIKTLYNGISSLKVSVEMLSERVSDLEKALDSVAKLVDEKTILLVNVSDELKKRLEEVNVVSKELSDKLPKNVTDIIGEFATNLNKAVGKLEEMYSKMLDELTLIKRSFGDQVAVTMEAVNEVKGDVLSLRSKVEELGLTVNELSSTVNRELAETMSKIHELELLVTDLSVRLASLEKRIRQVSHE